MQNFLAHLKIQKEQLALGKFRQYFALWPSYSPCSSSNNIGAYGPDRLLLPTTRNGKENSEDSYELYDETHNCALENMAEIDEAHQESILFFLNYSTIKLFLLSIAFS